MRGMLKSTLLIMLFAMTFVPVSGQTFVGSGTCKNCHNQVDADVGYNIYDAWENSGHPYKFSVIADSTAPVYPDFVVNFQDDWMTGLGDGSVTWDNVAGVIGGFGWKARFVGDDGYIVGSGGSAYATGLGHNQFNFRGGKNYGWVNYHETDPAKIYNFGCFKCHTTGGSPTGEWLEGVTGLGNFSEGGIGCEACHGPGSDHAAAPSTTNIDRVYEFAHDNTTGAGNDGLSFGYIDDTGAYVEDSLMTADTAGDDVNYLCGTCHNRDFKNPINAKGGFIKHHEQWDELTATKHYATGGQNCTTCHDPHKRTIWDGDGITKTCETCHGTQATTKNHNDSAGCIDCHMPFAAKSGTTRGSSGFKGDVRSHLFAITVDNNSMFTEDGSWVRDDASRSASLSPDFACLGCHNDDAHDAIPDMTLDQAITYAAGMHTARVATEATFVGSEACALCHDNVNANKGYNIFKEWKDSGHPYKFSVIENNTAPTYPDFVNNFQDTWMDSLGDGTVTWNNVAGVIGGFGWKARFVGDDGYVIGSGGSAYAAGVGHNQFNFRGGVANGWVDYHETDPNKIYNYSCFKCHTTGGDTSSVATWLDGVPGLGTFTEGGVGCEACHGPGSNHILSRDKADIDLVYEFAHKENAGLTVDGTLITPDPAGDDVNFLCGTCHNRDYDNPINSKGGFIKHHEQWDEITTTGHYAAGFDCATCHDPHKRTIWGGDGITKECATCHSTKENLIANHTTVDCIDCHMPFAAKSGATRGDSGFKGDVRSHLFSITVDDSSMFTADGSWVRDDSVRSASLSPDYTCLGCHNDSATDGITNMTHDEAVAAAKDIHAVLSIAPEMAGLPTAYALEQNYPNPFNPTSTITYKLPNTTDVQLVVFDIAGREVARLVDGYVQAGKHQIVWNAADQASGIYIAKLMTREFSHTIKMVLLK